MTWLKVSLRWTVLAVCLSQALSFRGIDCISVENTPTGLYPLQLPGLEWDSNKSHNAVQPTAPSVGEVLKMVFPYHWSNEIALRNNRAAGPHFMLKMGHGPY
jgi:hypothetical protein